MKLYYAAHQWQRTGEWQNSPFQTLTQAKAYAKRITTKDGESKGHVEVGKEVWTVGRIFADRTPIVSFIKQA